MTTNLNSIDEANVQKFCYILIAKCFLYLMIFFTITSCSLNNENEIDEITFVSISNSNPVCDSCIIFIEIEEKDDRVYVRSIFCDYIDDKNKFIWKDTLFNIDRNKFDKIVSEVRDTESLDISKTKFKYSLVADGNTIFLNYGTLEKYETYRFYIPQYRTESRGLSNFVKTIDLILKVGIIDSSHYLGNNLMLRK